MKKIFVLIWTVKAFVLLSAGVGTAFFNNENFAHSKSFRPQSNAPVTVFAK